MGLVKQLSSFVRQSFVIIILFLSKDLLSDIQLCLLVNVVVGYSVHPVVIVVGLR